MDRLREHLQLAHRDQKPQQTEGINDAKERSPEGRDALNTDYRDFLVVQTDEAPVERFLVREAAHDYPHIIGHFPKTGEWRDYTIEASGYPEDDRYIQVVKRWKYLGRPVLKRASDVPGAGETKGSPGYVSQTMADGGHERPPRGSSNAPVGLPDRTPRL
jgi:hypothetical protein